MTSVAHGAPERRPGDAGAGADRGGTGGHAETTAAPGVAWHDLWTAALVGYLVLTAVTFAVGFTITHLLPGSVGSWDESVNRWFAARRVPEVDDVTKFVTLAINTGPAVIAAVVISAWLALRRCWHEVVMLVTALLLEITVFLSTTFVIGRPRPHVVRLNSTPATSSFPSGHAAAATVILVGVALIVHRYAPVFLAALTGVVAALGVGAVAFSRVYRGMHHPTDVLYGILLGLGCLLAGWITADRATAPLPGHPRGGRAPHHGHRDARQPAAVAP